MKVDDFGQLPGAELLESGLKDLAAGTQSASAFLVAIGAPRLRRLGIALPPPEQMPSRPEHGLYRLLAQQRSRPHSSPGQLRASAGVSGLPGAQAKRPKCALKQWWPKGTGPPGSSALIEEAQQLLAVKPHPLFSEVRHLSELA